MDTVQYIPDGYPAPIRSYIYRVKEAGADVFLRRMKKAGSIMRTKAYKASTKAQKWPVLKQFIEAKKKYTLLRSWLDENPPAIFGGAQ